MNQKTKTSQFKIAKGELVSIASAKDIAVRLEQDQIVLRDQVKFLSNGEAHIKLTGVLLIMRASQIRPLIEQTEPVAKSTKPALFSADFDKYFFGEPDEEIDFKITSDGRYSCHVIWYGGERRPGRSGSRVVRGTNSFS